MAQFCRPQSLFMTCLSRSIICCFEKLAICPVLSFGVEVNSRLVNWSHCSVQNSLANFTLKPQERQLYTSKFTFMEDQTFGCQKGSCKFITVKIYWHDFEKCRISHEDASCQNTTAWIYIQLRSTVESVKKCVKISIFWALWQPRSARLQKYIKFQSGPQANEGNP